MVIPRFITQALRDEPLTVHGDGHATRDWLYVDDDADAERRRSGASAKSSSALTT